MTTRGVAEHFYSAFASRDWRTMGALYADDATFSDPAFPLLKATEARAMWRMLITRGTDLKLDYEVLDETHENARTRWTAHYTFTQTGRPVVNQITATMDLRDGFIVRHVDTFDFYRWAAQALGPAGKWLGWLPPFQRKVQAQADKALRRFIATLPEESST
jgi:ketosteroid isomerase-like protein